MKHWSATQTSFDQFLLVLDPDREAAGAKYEALRSRIIKYFEWRACRFADQLADETLDRVMRKIEGGERILDPAKYACGVSRLVYLETVKKQVKEEELSFDLPAPDETDEDLRLGCLEKCLAQLTDNSRSMILHYYRDDKRAKIDHRRKIAESFNISVNALRIKALRIRSMLEACVMRCVDKDPARK